MLDVNDEEQIYLSLPLFQQKQMQFSGYEVNFCRNIIGVTSFLKFYTTLQ